MEFFPRDFYNDEKFLLKLVVPKPNIQAIYKKKQKKKNKKKQKKKKKKKKKKKQKKTKKKN